MLVGNYPNGLHCWDPLKCPFGWLRLLPASWLVQLSSSSRRFVQKSTASPWPSISVLKQLLWSLFNWVSPDNNYSTVWIRDLVSTLVKLAWWLFLCHLWPFLNWEVFFEATGEVIKIGLSLKSNQACLNSWCTWFFWIKKRVKAISYSIHL